MSMIDDIRKDRGVEAPLCCDPEFVRFYPNRTAEIVASQHGRIMKIEAALLAAEELADAAYVAWRELVARRDPITTEDRPANSLESALAAYRKATGAE